jgi:hypothetical protein
MVPRRISWGKAYGSVQPTKTGPLAGFIFGPPARRGNAVGEASSFRGSFLPTHCIRLQLYTASGAATEGSRGEGEYNRVPGSSLLWARPVRETGFSLGDWFLPKFFPANGECFPFNSSNHLILRNPRNSVSYPESLGQRPLGQKISY